MRSGQQIWDVVPFPGKQKGVLSSMPTSPNHSSRQLEVAAQQVAFRSELLRTQQKSGANGKEKWGKGIDSHPEARFLEV